MQLKCNKFSFHRTFIKIHQHLMNYMFSSLPVYNRKMHLYRRRERHCGINRKLSCHYVLKKDITNIRLTLNTVFMVRLLCLSLLLHKKYSRLELLCVLTKCVCERVSNPAHFSLTCAHVWSGYIYTWT